jgi:hypothetical protein
MTHGSAEKTIILIMVRDETSCMQVKDYLTMGARAMLLKKLEEKGTRKSDLAYRSHFWSTLMFGQPSSSSKKTRNETSFMMTILNLYYHRLPIYSKEVKYPIE